MVAMAPTLSHAKRRGSVLVEAALIVPLATVLFLGLLQIVLLQQIDWLMDQAAEAACRAVVVSREGHPDPTVAAQLTLAPVTGTGWLRGRAPLQGMTGHYAAAIFKTRTLAQMEGNQATATVTHAAELVIPLAGSLLAPVPRLIPGLLAGRAGDWVDGISLVTGRPHLKLEKTLTMTFPTAGN